jgi:transcription-repair coupling factor (superfamily II helicase)
MQNQEEILNRFLADASEPGASVLDCQGLKGASAAFFLWQCYNRRPRPMVILTADAREAEALWHDLLFFYSDAAVPVLYFPPYNILPYKVLAYHNETAARRIKVLYTLLDAPRAPIVVTTIGAFLKRVIPKSEMGAYAELLMIGEDLDRSQLVEKLIDGGYTHSQIVEEPGDFCVRGGILDIFCPLYDHPLRVEFFGDTIDSLRFFSADTQRRLDELEEAVVSPAREAILPGDRLPEIISRIRLQANDQQLPKHESRRLISGIKEDKRFPGIESLLPLISPKLDTLLAYLPSNALMVEVEPADIENAAIEVFERAAQHYEAARAEQKLCIDPDRLFLSWPEACRVLNDRQRLCLRQLPVGPPDMSGDRAAPSLSYAVQDITPPSQVASTKSSREERSPFQALSDWITDQMTQGLAVHLVCRNANQMERVAGVLEPYGIMFERGTTEIGLPETNPQHVQLLEGQLSAGFVWSVAGVVILTDVDIFGVRRSRPGKRRRPADKPTITFGDLHQGDLVVHDEHGIGQYDGLTKLNLNRTENDFLTISYRGGDRLYLPVDRMGAIQKYMGVEGVTPVLDKMGGKSWEKVKARVKRSAERIAGELLKLYAARKVRTGFTFQSVDDYMAEFEGGFPYEETPDQLKAIEDVRQDMASAVPMDRLICGDVGYGKTEVALRAAFMAVFNGKQVAVLVPTTVLAEQHYDTFQQRFKRFGVQIESLSRFRSRAEQKDIIERLADGRIDIVIGTHRLLQKDIRFRELGIFILDEEQRFGVRHKEKLKKLRRSVDVLTLTATPIPRTLHLSLSGIRDISIISTPPEYRRSIITYVSEYSDGLVKEAVQREINRGGQVYFVHNHVASIFKMAEKISALVPEARTGVAHGQMSEDELEKAMMAFHRRDLDVLVTTTIIESGLDIPSANTIMVNRADRFGLAQMYQLRGRVGRAEEQAYAFLFIPKESRLTTQARKRLKVLMEHSDLGSGFQIAMNDLKIRGGGTILGASQSGHIAAVGYDMFLQLMEETMAELKGETVVQPLDPEINVPFSAYIPETCIPDLDQRLAMYRRLAKIDDPADIPDIKAELEDRFGDMPTVTRNLLTKILLKALAVRAGVKRLDLNNDKLILAFSEAHQRNPQGIVDIIRRDPKRFQLTPDYILSLQVTKNGAQGSIAQVKKILQEIARHVNN